MKLKMYQQQRKQSPAFITLMIIIGIVAFVSMLYVLRQSLTSRANDQSQGGNSNPAVETQVASIAAQFVCTCGTCGNETLDQCTCDNAREARQLIRSGVLSGQPVDRVIAVVDSTYEGRIQSPFANPTAGTSTTKLKPEEVLVHFRCPCGKCGMDNLAECVCDHPRGGREVRQFLSLKLSQADYSPDQMIAEIEKSYGKRRF